MKKTDIILLISAPFLGFFSFLAPFIISGFDKIASDKILVTISSIYENVKFLPTVALLFIVGIFLGYFGQKIWWLISIVTIIIFPINAIIEMIILPKSHNLWPIEFAIYLFMALPAVIGAYFGKIIREKKRGGVKPWVGGATEETTGH